MVGMVPYTTAAIATQQQGEQTLADVFLFNLFEDLYQ